MEARPNTRIRLFRIALSTTFRDKLSILVNKRINDQHDIDAHCGDKNSCYEKLALLCSNSEVIVSHPDD